LSGRISIAPAYVTALRSRPVALLVVTDDASVARWARHAIETGHPGFVLTPIVIDLHDVPRVTDPERARETPELAVLSAIAHPELATARAALTGISVLREERKHLYSDLVLRALPSDLQEVIGNDMLKNYEYQSNFARKYYGQGKTEGKAEGHREIALSIAQMRVPALSAELAARIEAATDATRLQQLITTMVAAPNEQAVCTAIEMLTDAAHS
jgi:hypothetical protein